MFIVLFEDNPNADAAIRKTHMEDHLSFLQRHADTVVAAGPLIERDGSIGSGLWIVDSPSRETVIQLIKEDPFWPTGLRSAFEIKQWRQVFADGQRQI
ncbi:MAG: YciI family protein [Pseudomonadota bacterium]